MSRVKLRHVVLLRLELQGMKIAQNVVKVRVHSYLSNGHANLWSNFNSKKLSKVKLHCTVSLGLGLKEVKIARNIMKVGVHSYLPNSHLNLWSNFNSKILVKSETPSCGFCKVGVKVGEDSSERHKSWGVHLSIKWETKPMIKFNFRDIGEKWNFIVHFH